MREEANLERIALLLLTFLLTGCASEWYARSPAPPCTIANDQVIYLVGDFGKASEILEDVGASLARTANQPADAEPTVIALGDNLYVSGLLRCPAADCLDTAEAAALGQVVERLKDIEAEVILLPGNHDHDSNVLDPDPPGDAAHWYFLKGVGVEARWRPGLGDASEFADAQALFDHLYHAPDGSTPAQALRHFFAPKPVVDTPEVLIVGIDSQLLIDLYDVGEEALAAEYLEDLERELGADAAWKAVAAHHPLETYGKHRPALPMRFLFGPGWPQFPEWWHKITAIPGLGTLATSAWWLYRDEQNIHSGPNRRYREALLPVLQRTRTHLFLAGHDHNTQLIDLAVARKEPSAPPLLQVLTGEGAKEDPVARGKGTLAYHTGGGFVRTVFNDQRVCIELFDRHGEPRYQHLLARKKDE